MLKKEREDVDRERNVGRDGLPDTLSGDRRMRLLPECDRESDLNRDGERFFFTQEQKGIWREINVNLAGKSDLHNHVFISPSASQPLEIQSSRIVFSLYNILSIKKLKIMMFSESQMDGGFTSTQFTNSPAATNRDTAGVVPLTIKQISEASHSGDDQSNFVVSGADVVNVTVVGMVSNIVERNTDVNFTVDDGTGKLNCKRWLNDPFDKLQIEDISEGIYVRVDGHLRSYRGERHVAVFSVRPVTNFDEITFHFIACIHNHVRTTKGQKIQGDVTTLSQNINSTPNTPIQNGTNGFKTTPLSQLSVPFTVDGLKGFDQMVLAYLQLPANYGNEKGIHTNELAQKLKLSHDKIMESIRTLEDEGMIYSTIDEFHYKATSSS
ncbi:hypothetical protein L2E82_29756 [Cichorium intybus]|uniref:Uncharacterized protein n=1 Tax=Cichorium intybus TaxID=13427 RepID=A0ACB9CYV7_CICIN|nr:hypothetical protein L2E82_29756 [Cichorium intybus]